MTASVPQVSVLSVVRNVERWIDACAESVLRQEGVDLEWVVVDNGSDDGTAARLHAWSARDARVRVQLAGENLRQAAGLVRALQAARAPFAAVLDGDDFMLPGRLARSLAWLEGGPRRVAVYGEADFIDEAGRPLAPWFIARDAAALRRLAEFTMPAIHSTSTWRTDWLRACGDPLPCRSMAYDYYLLTRALEDGEVGWLPVPLAAYRVHPANQSHRFPNEQLAVGMAISMAAALRRSGRPPPGDEIWRWATEAANASIGFAEIYTAAARHAWANGLLRHTLYYARRAIRRGQWQLLPLVARVLWRGRHGRDRLWPIMRGGLLAAARVDGEGRSRADT